MSRDVKYQVFISSTFEDLQDERRRLMEQVLNLGHIPVGMELFKASNSQQWAYITKRILSCDYYLLIVAERYGSVDANGKSYTQKEYEFAVANGIPVAAFLLDCNARRDRRTRFVEHERKDEIEAFRTLCSSNKMVTFWTDPSDLALRATNALLGLIEEEPRLGWVRADQSADAALRELAKLAEEKRVLEDKLASVGASVLIPPPDVAYHLDRLASLYVDDFIDKFDKNIIEYTSRDLVDIFISVSRRLASGITEYDLLSLINNVCGVTPKLSALRCNFNRYIVQEFAAFGLIRPSRETTEFGSVQQKYSVTEYGLKVLMFAEHTKQTMQSP